MYSEEAINLVVNRIKWRTPTGEFATILNAENTASENQISYQDSHKLVTISNIHYSQNNEEITNEEFNSLLRSLVVKSTNQVLRDVYVNSEYSNIDFDYSMNIEKYVAVLENALLLSMAIQVGELIISSTRISVDDTKLNMSYHKAKVEVEGAINDSGNVISVGFKYRYDKAIKEAIKKVFNISKTPKIKSIDW
jgi:hypothetical protein